MKNIPYGTTAETLRSLFEPHGDIPRLLIPPSGTLAVVEYMHAEEAERAFRGVAYRRLGNSIIYLEWAPEGMLAVGSATGVSRAEVKPVTIREQDEGTTEPESVSIRSGSTLFVKNLSFATTTDRLAQVFRGLPSFAFARVQMKPAQPNHRTKIQPEEEKLSMGFGFVGFTDVVAARKAMKSMQGFVLDGHKLHVAFAGRGADEERKGEVMPKTKTAKMIVKNVPFEATKNDIRDLFGWVEYFDLHAPCRWLTFVCHNSRRAVYTGHSSPYACPKSSTRGRAALHSSSSSRGTRQRMRSRRYVTPICLGVISCWTGQRKASRTWRRSGARWVLASVGAVSCRGRRGSWRFRWSMNSRGSCH